ncbi:MAG: Outer rane lipoprotein Blc [Pseudomonadota bacterium]|nr:Outer rane lipoprotein Blc [Pseudomonadota bacterium]
MMTPRILLIEDEPSIAEAISWHEVPSFAQGGDHALLGITFTGNRLKSSISRFAPGIGPIIFDQGHPVKKFLLLLVCWLGGCTVAPPDGVTPITGFDLNRYLGAWYEIARLDHSFERGLSNVSANYQLREDGGVKVLNRGYHDRQDLWKEAEGRAYFIGEPTVGSLKVSFFGPFYGGYHIIALDQDQYGWVMISGPTRDYLWILARTRQLPPAVLERLIEQAKTLGFATEELIWVKQDRNDG